MRPGTTAWRGNSGASFQLAGARKSATKMVAPLFLSALSLIAEPIRLDFTGPGMGTTFRIALYAEAEKKPEAGQAVAAAFARLAALNAVFSDYEPNSEINRLAAAAPKPWPASAELFALTGRALELAALTEGTFDPACGRLTRLWRSSRHRGKLPPPERLQNELAGSGWRAVVLDASKRTITVTTPGLLLDFGGIAKGHAADQILRVLEESGFERALVQAGGDTAAGEPPPGEKGWPVTLRTGLEKDEDNAVTLKLARQAVSTSGDLHQFMEIDGQRYSHIIDPRTGLGLTRRLACSVIAADATTSDALATALCVLGPERGRGVAVRAGVSARWVWTGDSGGQHEVWVKEP